MPYILYCLHKLQPNSNSKPSNNPNKHLNYNIDKAIPRVLYHLFSPPNSNASFYCDFYVKVTS